jgi:type I restriction enzyme M protein
VAKRHANRVGSLESLFLRLEELVLANSGQDEFSEVFKLLVAKLWDERGGKAPRFRACERPADTYAAVAALLRDAEKAWPGILEPRSTPGLTAEHLQVCVEALAMHTVSDAGLTVMDGFFEFLVARGAKGAKGQFFTPRHVVEFCVRMLRPRVEETVLDPACGSGGFLIHALDYVRREGRLQPPEISDYCATKLWGFDIDARAVRVAKALMLLAGDGSANVLQLNSLLQESRQGQLPFGSEFPDGPLGLTVEDVCRARLRHHKGFDLILTNPPFAGDVREPTLLETYALSRGKPRVERDVLFLERCLQLLRPGGRMAIVLPHNKFATDAWGHAREWLLHNARVVGVVGLGRNTFLPHTHQKASVLFAVKTDGRKRCPHDERIFFAVSERDGKNSKGRFLPRPGVDSEAAAWDRVDHDLDEVLAGFRRFCDEEALLEG